MSNEIKTKGSGVWKKLNAEPGWEVEDDGHGLLTSVVTFKGDKDAEMPAAKSKHPGDERLQLHRAKYSIIGGKAKLVTAYYVGIAEGIWTTCEWEPDSNMTSQKIQTHPNFNKTAWVAEQPLSKLGWDPARNQFSPDTDSAAAKYDLVGQETYVRPEMSIGVLFYTSDKSTVQAMIDNNGSYFMDLKLKGMDTLVLPKNIKMASQYRESAWLMAGVNYKPYAHLWKVSFRILVATGGWHKYIYPKAQTK